MAVSKAFVFPDETCLAADLGKAMGHPCRVLILSRLLKRVACAYSDLIVGLPLAESTIKQHLDILKRLGMLQPVLLLDGTAGYCLNRERYLACAAAVRSQLGGTRVLRLLKEEGVEAG